MIMTVIELINKFANDRQLVVIHHRASSLSGTKEKY